MSSLPKKIIPHLYIWLFSYLLIFALGYWVIGLFSTPVHAKAPGDIFSQQTLEQKNQQEKTAREQETGKPDEVQVFSTRVNNQLMGDTMYNMTNMIVCTNEEVCTNNPQGREKGKPLSALGAINYGIGKLYEQPPASFLAYVQDLLFHAGFIKPVYAQGIGFSGLTSFLPLWKTTRNIAYLVLIIIMVAIGFMIIFRTKIDPKTVISVQAALPKIVLTLLIITFSYPIVGFLIDMMYLVMAIAISLFVSGVGGNIGGADIANLQSKYMTANLGDLFGAVFWPLGGILKGLVGILTGALIGSGLISSIAGIWAKGLITSSFTIPLIAVGVPLLIIFIIVLGLLFTFIRLFMLLLNSYIQLLIGLILGPILLLGEAIPGKSAFSGWILNIIANLVVFPATAIIIMFSVFLVTTGQTDSPTLSPPFVGLGGGNFSTILSLGVIFLAPSLVAQIKKAFHPKPAIPMSAGTAFAPLTGGAQSVMGGMSQLYYAKGFFDMFKSKH